ncbi:uncharacterized protein NPIL_243991 [Nephila pilipes]|uniref:Uncharacterized protein n=1 Tax=Nephila pilipes TaxID=299642 RepID=A0A8X6QAG2_NEPPI|nr:uncharacterized protein NPIL_243991 [Nephila pilipes]
MLADKLEAFDNIRRSLHSGPRRQVKPSETLNDGNRVTSKKPERIPKHSYVVPNERPPFKYYSCWRPGVIMSRCPTCNPNSFRRSDVATNHVNAYATATGNPRLILIHITFCGKRGCICVDT